MRYVLSKQFEKDFAKLPKRSKDKVVAQLLIFIADQFDERLRNHALSGKWKAYRSIDITGDIRAVYTLIEPDIAQFIAIGSHSELYS